MLEDIHYPNLLRIEKWEIIEHMVQEIIYHNGILFFNLQLVIFCISTTTLNQA